MMMLREVKKLITDLQGTSDVNKSIVNMIKTSHYGASGSNIFFQFGPSNTI